MPELSRRSRRGALRRPVRACLFDRDGTLIVDVPYNADPAAVVARPGARRALERLRRAGVLVGVVTNQGSPASPVDLERIPLEILSAGAAGTRHLLEIAEACGARFVLASTSEVYGDPEVVPQREDYPGRVNPVGPRAVYDEAKRYAEALTATYHRHRGLSVGIARIFNTYGPRARTDDGRVVPAFLGGVLSGEPLVIYGDGRATRAFCYVDDLVEGLIALAASDYCWPVNLGSADEVTIGELARLIAEVAGRPLVLAHAPGREDDPVRRCPDLSLARALLGYEPSVSLRAGLARCLEARAAQIPTARR